MVTRGKPALYTSLVRQSPRYSASPSGKSDATLFGSVTTLSIDVLETLCVQEAGTPPLSGTGRRVARRCAPVGPGTQGWSSFLQEPLWCRRGGPSSSKQSLRCCRCLLGRKERRRGTSHTECLSTISLLK